MVQKISRRHGNGIRQVAFKIRHLMVVEDRSVAGHRWSMVGTVLVHEMIWSLVRSLLIQFKIEV